MGERESVCVVIPTYNERDNIASIIPAIAHAMHGLGLKYEIIVVDDNSPDGTGSKVLELSQHYPVKLVSRPCKMGLGSAIRDGVKVCSGDYVVVMDADFQHPPELVPQMVRMLASGCDLVVASRYTRGGGVEGWSVLRYLISRGAVLLAHILLPRTRGVSDAVSGFFAFRRDVVDENSLSARSMKVILDVLCLGRWRRACEAPYTFRGRARGASKLGLRDIVSYALHVLSLVRHCKHYYCSEANY